MATSKPHGIRPVTYHLRWLLDMVDFFTRDTIKMPSGYRDEVLETKNLLKNDISGLTNTMLDFAISSAIDVDYRIETNNSKDSRDWTTQSGNKIIKTNLNCVSDSLK